MTVRADVRGSFAWNALALSAAQLGAPVLNAAVVILLARWATPEALGRYSVLVTAFLVVDQVRQLGLQRFVTRELAGGRAGAIDALRGFVGIADAGTPIAAALYAAYAMTSGAPALAIAFFALGLLPAGRVAANDAVFISCGRADYTARIVAAEGIARALVSILILFVRGADLAALGAVYAAGRFLAAAMGTRYRRGLLDGGAEGADWSAGRALLRQVPAFFTVTALPLLLLRADLLVVNAVATARDVGFYGAAARLVSILLVLPDGIMLANFARLSQLTDRDSLRRTIGAVVAAVVGVVTIPALAVSYWAGAIAVRVYGPAFAASGTYLALLIWSVPMFLLCRAFGDALVAAGLQRRLAAVILATTAASVPLYAVLPHQYGAIGAAYAYLGSLGVLLVLSVCAARIVLSPLRETGAQAIAPLAQESR